MPVLSGAGVIFYQSTSELTQKDVHWAMIFLAIIALALVAQAIGVLISAAFGAKLLQKVNAIATIVETKTGPIMDRTASILKDLEPKVKSVGDSAEQITSTVRLKVDELGVTISELNATMRDINGRTRVQVARADGIVTDALQTTAEISNTVQHEIKKPLRQMVGVIAGVRAAVDTLVSRSPFGNRGRATKFTDYE
jgi:methyl-accepting chemotaxis protein